MGNANKSYCFGFSCFGVFSLRIGIMNSTITSNIMSAITIGKPHELSCMIIVIQPK
jgi:hypothetical protein